MADPWFRDAGRMVVAGIIGFAIAAQFVSLYGLEVPYYIALIGAGALKLSSTAPLPAMHQEFMPMPPASTALGAGQAQTAP